MNLVPDQPIGVVALCEGRPNARKVLGEAKPEISCHTGVEDTPGHVREDVDEVVPSARNDTKLASPVQPSVKTAYSLPTVGRVRLLRSLRSLAMTKA